MDTEEEGGRGEEGERKERERSKRARTKRESIVDGAGEYAEERGRRRRKEVNYFVSFARERRELRRTAVVGERRGRDV